MLLNFILVGVVGMIIGYSVIPALFGYGKLHGEIRFYDNTELGEDPVMTAELFEHPENIRKHKYVIFRVSPK